MALGDRVQVGVVKFGSTAEKLGLEPGFDITQVEVPADRPAKEWAFIPALGLLALIVVVQRGRVRREKKPVGAAKPV